MRLNYHEHYYPSNDVVFSVMFSKRQLFCALVSAVTWNKVAAHRERNIGNNAQAYRF